MNIFKLPDLGEGLHEAEIVSWHKQKNDPIKQGEPLVAVETAKAIIEIPSPESGTIDKLFGDEGDIVQVGDPLVAFAQTTRADSGTVVGEVKAGSEIIQENADSISKEKTNRGIRVTPAVRALARRLEVDLSIVTPTGPNDSISVKDVQRVAKILAEVGPMETLRGVRRAMARTMSQSHAEVVPVTLFDQADIHHWAADEDISIRLIRAIVAAATAVPELNAWYDTHAIGRRLLKKVNLGVAVDTREGLFVPVIADIGQYDTAGLRTRLDYIKAAVADRSIPAEELRGHSFMLSNFGTLAGRFATPVVVPPAVAILGTGVCYDAVIAENGSPVVHRLLPLSLTFDHRAVTGGEASRFLASLIDSLTLQQQV